MHDIKHLEDMGFEVDVVHLRYYSQPISEEESKVVADGWIYSIEPISKKSAIDKGFVISNVELNGGQTIVTVSKNNLQIRAYAVCSEHDSFCRKTGRQVAIARVMKLLE